MSIKATLDLLLFADEIFKLLSYLNELFSDNVKLYNVLAEFNILLFSQSLDLSSVMVKSYSWVPPRVKNVLNKFLPAFNLVLAGFQLVDLFQKL